MKGAHYRLPQYRWRVDHLISITALRLPLSPACFVEVVFPFMRAANCARWHARRCATLRFSLPRYRLRWNHTCLARSRAHHRYSVSCGSSIVAHARLANTRHLCGDGALSDWISRVSQGRTSFCLL